MTDNKISDSIMDTCEECGYEYEPATGHHCARCDASLCADCACQCVSCGQYYCPEDSMPVGFDAGHKCMGCWYGGC